ncbi:putative endonuclease/exonuclease/phosphatase family protein [Bifidobacterium adolescentis ATCC 15703]|uniref:Endonuclease/exonuclease/phosphatase family protein n=1 Tax=Bifidobacterium adolescentis (strain ATCC 15703 / DSM 20083 / NCTC 11814 / E194a) TaxID=367928 RepID=A1A3U9_BIFAA|nr:putative endonuclease/exonuclease/phosphatase family protein [Bifidobacterium adolescentis ATCC 15703]
MRIRSPATCARSGATAANATAPGRSRPPWKGRASPRPGDASATSCANRACGRVRARTVRTAQDAGRRGQAREPAGPRVRRLRPAHASGGRSYLCPRRRRLGVRVSAGRPGGQGHRRPFRRADPRTQAWCWARSPPSASR